MIKSYLLVILAYVIMLVTAISVIAEVTREDKPTPCVQVDTPEYELAPRE